MSIAIDTSVFDTAMTSADALRTLRDGNYRFRNGLRSIEAMPTQDRIRALAQDGQKPFAIFVSCSDSRVPAEIVFDRGLGDLFMVRLAGNIVPTSALASIEFAAINFGSPLIVVMGHTECGAIKAAVDTITNEKSPELTESLSELISQIAPSVRTAAFDKPNKKDLIRRATIDNIKRSVDDICRNSEVIRDLVDDGKLAVIGALYDMHTGDVDFGVTPECECSRLLQGELKP